MSEHATETVSVTEYLVTRLRQLGRRPPLRRARRLHPRAARRLDARPTVRWVGTANELGAAYAADGYAPPPRVRRAADDVRRRRAERDQRASPGAFAEHVPVLHDHRLRRRRGTQDGLAAASLAARRRLRPLLAAPRRVTVAQAPALTAGDDAGAQIDARPRRRCRDEHRPGYLRIPADLVDEPVPAAPLSRAGPRGHRPRGVEAFRRPTARLCRRRRHRSSLTGRPEARRSREAPCQPLPTRAAAQWPRCGARACRREPRRCVGLYAGAASDPAIRAAIEDCGR